MKKKSFESVKDKKRDNKPKQEGGILDMPCPNKGNNAFSILFNAGGFAWAFWKY